MIEHDGCTGYKYFNADEVKPNSPCYECEGAHKSKTLSDNYTLMTNADRIRNMTDEELAKHIDNELDYPENKANCLDCEETSCYKCILEWLQRVVEE